MALRVYDLYVLPFAGGWAKNSWRCWEVGIDMTNLWKLSNAKLAARIEDMAARMGDMEAVDAIDPLLRVKVKMSGDEECGPAKEAARFKESRWRDELQLDARQILTEMERRLGSRSITDVDAFFCIRNGSLTGAHPLTKAAQNLRALAWLLPED